MQMFYFRLRELRNDSDGQTIEFQRIDRDGCIGEPLVETFPDVIPDMGLVAIFAFEVIGKCKIVNLLSTKAEAYCQVRVSDEMLAKPSRYDELLSKNVFTAN